MEVLGSLIRLSDQLKILLLWVLKSMFRKKENNITFRSAVSQLRPDGCRLHQKAAGSTWGQAFLLLDQKAFFFLMRLSGYHHLRSVSFGRQKTNGRMPAGFSTLIKSPRVTGLVSRMIQRGLELVGRGHWKREGRCHDGWAQGRLHDTRLGPAQKQPLCQYPCPVVRKSSNQFIPAHTRKWEQQWSLCQELRNFQKWQADDDFKEEK